jgi:hypothetical protein
VRERPLQLTTASIYWTGARPVTCIMESQKTLPNDGPSSGPLPPLRRQHDEAVVTTSSSQQQQQQQQQQGNDTQVQAAAVASAGAHTPTGKEAIPELPPLLQKSASATVSSSPLQPKINERTSVVAITTVTVGVSENDITTTQRPPTLLDTAASSPTATKSSTRDNTMAAETDEELERQAGLLPRKWEEMFSRLQLFRSINGKRPFTIFLYM